MLYLVLSTLPPSWENKLGVDVDVCAFILMHGRGIHVIQDNYCIVVSEGLERLNTLQNHLVLVDGSDQPSNCFLRLHFKGCPTVSACHGDVLEDYQEPSRRLRVLWKNLVFTMARLMAVIRTG